MIAPAQYDLNANNFLNKVPLVKNMIKKIILF